MRKRLIITLCCIAVSCMFFSCKAEFNNKNDPLSDDYLLDENRSLSVLQLSSGTLRPEFSAAVFSYASEVTTGVTAITVTAETATPYSTIRVNGTDVSSGSASDELPLNVGDNLISIVVTAEDDSLSQAYTINIYRAIGIPKTGQTECYDNDGTVINCTDTEQDGDLQKGVEWPDPRFYDLGDGTVRDHLTGLVWYEDANLPSSENYDPDFTGDGSVLWMNAFNFVTGMNDGTYQNGGSTDWRLPNVNELRSLINYGNSDPEIWLNTVNSNVFSQVQGGYYHTSTTPLAGSLEALVVNFSNGQANGQGMKNGNYYYVWAVKTGVPGTTILPRTGQVNCYGDNGNDPPIECTGDGQDGELQNGIEWPDPRFIDNNDGTITDRLTGLMWEAQGSELIPVGGWFSALAEIKNSTLAGHDDWRAPNVNELASLLNYGTKNIDTWLISQGFDNIKSAGYYLTSTTNAADTGDVWTLSTYESGIIPFGKNGSLVVLMVRDME